MAITIEQIKDLGFKPAKKKSPFAKNYDTLVFALNKTDYLYVGYNKYRNQVNNKTIWKSFVDPDTNERIAYEVIKIGEIGYTDMKNFLERSLINSNRKYEEYGEDITTTRSDVS